MSETYTKAYRSPELSGKLIEKIKQISRKPVRLMEVCGTHTMALFKHGIRSVLPDTVTLLSGPGCPVCVTAQEEIDAMIAASRVENAILATFGDLIRVPGTQSSLQNERAGGRDVRIVYSVFDAVELAQKYPDKQVVFAGVGFETTAPTVAAAIFTAAQTGLKNFSVLSAHKLVPPALFALIGKEKIQIDGFLLPGHVSVIIGVHAYLDFFDTCQIPCVVAGFEPGDMLHAIFRLISQVESGCPALENAYPRAVSEHGNPQAVKLMDQVFETVDARWRGLGEMRHSGLAIKDAFAAHDAWKRFDIPSQPAVEPKGCACGEILTGVKTPPDCPLYKKTCTPLSPVGPCMVSSEGTCAAFYRYSED